MGFESRFDREYERNRRLRNEQTTKKLEAAAKLNTPELSDFQDSPEHQADVAADESYVKATEAHFDDDPSYHAKALEHFFQFGIAQGRLLSDPENSAYETEQIWVTRYDDLRNRIDTAATVHVYAENSPDGEEHSLAFGIDLTTNPDPDVIRRKLLVGSNDPNADFPAGFSQLKYYRDYDGFRTRRTCIPRYCIGMSSESTDDFLDGVTVQDGQIHIKPGTEAVPAFKILYEMSKQNELFQTALYRKEELEIISEDEEQALRNMEILDNIYLKELDRIAKLLPPWATQGCKKKDGSYNIDEIANRFMEGEDQDETFTAVINTTSELLERFEQDTSYIDGEPDPDLLKKAGERLRRTPAQRNQLRGHATLKTGARFAAS